LILFRLFKLKNHETSNYFDLVSDLILSENIRKQNYNFENLAEKNRFIFEINNLYVNNLKDDFENSFKIIFKKIQK
jgi:hypothetical protein